MPRRSLVANSFAVPLAVFLSSISSEVGAQANPALAVTNVNVVDVRAGAVLPGRTILIAGDRIEVVDVSDKVEIPEGATVLNASGAYVIPGLLDMHAHLRGGTLPTWVTTDWFMPLMLANGVTGVREMTSDCENPQPGRVCLTQVKEWQAQIEAGDLLGPRLLALSTWQVNPEQEIGDERVRQLVERFSEQEVDLIKIYPRLTSETFARIMREARRLNIAVGGHIPFRVTLMEASNAGLRSVEHARDFLFDCFPGSAEFRRTTRSQDPPTAELQAMVSEYDSRQCAEVFRTLVSNDTWYVPTHLTRRAEAFAFAGDSILRNDPRMKYAPQWLIEDWSRDANNMVARDATPAGRQALLDFYLKGLEITGEAHRAGVRTLVGTDGGDTFAFPGSGLHDEMGELVSAGLSHADVLRAATLNGAEFLGISDRYGSVEPDKRADLILLDANPLEDIANIRTIRAVIFGGSLLNRERLDDLLQLAETTATRPL